MPGCSVNKCTHQQSKNFNCSFFSFPKTNDFYTRQQWTKALSREFKGILDAHLDSYKVCECHFDPKHIIAKTKQKHLVKGAWPTLNLGHSKNMKEVKLRKDPEERRRSSAAAELKQPKPKRAKTQVHSDCRSIVGQGDLIDSAATMYVKRMQENDVWLNHDSNCCVVFNLGSWMRR